MGLWDDFTSGISGFFDSAGSAASDVYDYGASLFSSSQPFTDFGTDLAAYSGASYQPQGYAYSPASPAVYQPVMAAAGPVMGGIARAGAVVGRSFFQRFPNLAVAIQGFRNAGMNITRSKLYSLLRRFGPDFLIAGGILSAAAVSELVMAGPGRRRMNVGNVKALRRAHRRMKGFHHVCQVNDTLLTHRRRRSSSGRGCGTSITQVK